MHLISNGIEIRCEMVFTNEDIVVHQNARTHRELEDISKAVQGK